MVLDQLSNFQYSSVGTNLISLYLQIFPNIGTFSKVLSASQCASGFLLLVDLSKPFALYHREWMRTHSNHLSDSSVNTLHVCSTNV